MTSPLAGTRVLDLSQAVSGPYAGRILGDLGADVVKVEWPNGDVTNLFGEVRGGLSGLFTQMNASKRGVSIDRRAPGGPELVRLLAGEADVVIENFRPGVLDRAGLGYGDLSDANPQLVMLSISGFGRTSPEADRQAYAPVIHAESSLLRRQAELDDRPPVDLGLALADTLAALHGVIAVLSALKLRDLTGTGQHIDLAMLDAIVASDDYAHHAIDENHEVYAPRGDIWDAPGGPILVAADPKTLWVKLARQAGLGEPTYPDGDLAAKIGARREAIASWIGSFTDRKDLIAALEAADLAWADLRTTRTLLDSPSLQAREMVARVRGGDGQPRGVVRTPYRFSDADCDVRHPPPARGQHNREVLVEWLGLSDDDLARLEESGTLLG